jgi:hypothetical protein
MGHIFISYARADSGIVDQIVKKIESSGYQVWIDRGGIQPGAQWKKSIVEAIESADIVLVILSVNSVNSDNVRREIDIAVTANKQIMPISIEKVEIPSTLKYQLAGVQILDFNTEGLRPLLLSLETTQQPTKKVKEPNSQSRKSPTIKSSKSTPIWPRFITYGGFVLVLGGLIITISVDESFGEPISYMGGAMAILGVLVEGYLKRKG